MPRPASTVMLLRRIDIWQVLMVLRPAGGAFGGVWVFPGGVVDDVDHDAVRYGFDDPWRAAALRETAEEVGIYITTPPMPEHPRTGSVLDDVAAAGARFDPSRLRYVSTLVTPEGAPRRFDTRFFLAEVERDTHTVLARDELEDLRWMAPEKALTGHRDGDFPMMLPTVIHLAALADAADPRAVAIPAGLEVELVDGIPRLVRRSEGP